MVGTAVLTTVAALAVSGALSAGSAAAAAGEGIMTRDAVSRASNAAAGTSTGYVAPKGTKVNILGEWAHPDDDTSIIGPCGVWHQEFGTTCGIIQVTRGEGGGNATGTEAGPDLGLRRENEDRVAHFRSGTLSLYYLDKVDFFYNQSAPLTQQIWNQQDTLRRVTRIIRTTQPDIYIGFTPTLAAGHGNHQDAGRLIWEGMQAAADPTMFPGQLKGPHALSTWQVKKIYSGGSTAGTGGTTASKNCTTGFVPAATNLDTVSGVWTGYDSPYAWPSGNLQGQPAGSAKIWQQVADEGRSAYPTQSRVMYTGTSAPACPKFAMTDAFVPFQPNVRADGTANPAAGMDDSILYGAVVQDPGGLPLGTTEHLTTSSFYNAPGTPFQVTLHASPGSRSLTGGQASLTVPPGWTTSGPQQLQFRAGGGDSATFTVTPPTDATVEQFYRISAQLKSGDATGYTDTVVRVVPPAEGRFQRWGKWAEYDTWLDKTAPEARRLGRSDAVATIGVGRTESVPVVVHNWSDQSQSGTVSLSLPDGLTAPATSKDYGPLAAGQETTVSFDVTDQHTDDTLPATQLVNVPITTTYSAPSGSASETLSVSVVPTTAIPQAATAPTVDGTAAAGEYTGQKLDIGRIWQGASGCTSTADCGESGTSDANSSWAKVTWSNDALYFYTHITDDYQAYAVTPQECVAHWLADSVEFQIDPRGNASVDAMDTGSTFKLGVFPYTNDPSNVNGNGANGPCWERDADNHQGYSTGPLAATVADAPNAPGVQVASTAHWVGDNQTTTDHSYAGGGYDLEVKIPMADLPAAVDPQRMGLNITPYDNDNTAAAGTTTLRHIDNSTRLAWSAFNSVQSDPYRWGLATLPGYTPPADRPTVAPPPNVGHPNLDGTDSPQTILQSATNGVPIAGRDPAPGQDMVTSAVARLGASSVTVSLTASGAGTVHAFAMRGEVRAIPVWQTSCSMAADPPPDYGLTPCAVTDGATPPWSPDMSGHQVADKKSAVKAGVQQVTIPLTADQVAALRSDHGQVLVSFVTSDGNGVQALALPLT
ncbi:MAG: PIG-L family deacetylase [Nocardioides sp.]|nr:PIG-L family deacetylase [Nocardioides sp.]